MLRSALFCPANNRKILNKTASLRPDAFIYDLEDAVTASAKITARDTLIEFLSSNPLPQPEASRATVAVRVNCPLTTDWGEDDIAKFSGQAIVNTLVLPKVETTKSINTAIAIINENRNPEYSAINIWAMIETARGVLNAEIICDHTLVEAIVFGSNDLTKDLKAVHMADRSPLLFSMSKCVLAARASGKHVIDGVFNDFKDEVSFRESCIMGRNMGFDGRSLIHPSQINPANMAYSPSKRDIEEAKETVSAWAAALSEGKSLAVVRGKLVEELHFLEAQDLLDRATFIEQMEE